MSLPRDDEPVVKITMSVIYNELLGQGRKIDKLIDQVPAIQKTLDSHETRIQQVEVGHDKRLTALESLGVSRGHFIRWISTVLSIAVAGLIVYAITNHMIMVGP